MKLSVVISAYNEENKIEACLQSVSFADEIVFVDNTSTDETQKIAKKYTKIIQTVPNRVMLNTNKNIGFSKAKSEWILSLDADERITPELAAEIQKVIIEADRTNGYWIPRKNIIFKKWIQSDMWWPDYQMRLFRRGKGRFPEKHVHEYLEVEGNTEKLRNPMVHENYASISQYIYKMDKIYTENEAGRIIASGTRLHWLDSIRMPLNDFMKTFFLQKGYKSGLHGLILSLLQAFYMEIVFLKIWERNGFPEYESKGFLHRIYKELKKYVLEFRFWFLSCFIQDTTNSVKKTFYRLQRAIVQRKVSHE